MTLDTAQLSDVPAKGTCVFDRAWHAMPNNVARSRRDLLACLGAEVPGDVPLEAIGAAVTEATTNSVYHAYVGRHIGQFQISAGVLADEIVVTVEDDGSGFDPQAVRTGRGLPLMSSLASRVETAGRSGGGSVTTMWFARGAS